MQDFWCLLSCIWKYIIIGGRWWTHDPSISASKRKVFDLYKLKSAHECTTPQQVNRKDAGKATSPSSEHNCEDVDTSAVVKIEVVNVAKPFGRQEAKRPRRRTIVVTQWASRWRSLSISFQTKISLWKDIGGNVNANSNVKDANSKVSKSTCN